MRHVSLGIAALALLGLPAPEAAACGWLWACADRPHVSRAYPYRGHARAYRYRPGGYGYTRRAYGYTYSTWPSTIRPSRWYLGTALPATGTNSVGLTQLVVRDGQVWGGMPADGPSLFGPQPYYGYGTPSYGYTALPYGPPPETPSWWVEPRRRR